MKVLNSSSCDHGVEEPITVFSKSLPFFRSNRSDLISLDPFDWISWVKTHLGWIDPASWVVFNHFFSLIVSINKNDNTAR